VRRTTLRKTITKIGGMLTGLALAACSLALAAPAEAPTSATVHAVSAGARPEAASYGFSLGGNTPADFLGLFVTILLAYVAGRIVRLSLARTATRLTAHHRTILAETAGSLARSLPLLILIYATGLGLMSFIRSAPVLSTALGIVHALTAAAIGLTLYRLVDVANLWAAEQARKSNNRLDDMLVPILRASLRATVIVLTVVQVATALSDKPITSILAGLGIGGIAVALAAQDSIRNFFGSILIFFDKPFAVADRVIVDGHDGKVEEVGLRSTRIRTSDGHLVSIPNGELASKVIHNVGRSPFVRRAFQIEIPYDTPYDLVQRAVELLKVILRDHEGMRPEFPPRVHLRDLTTSALVIEAIYWYHPGNDHWRYMAFSEKVNFEILRRFDEEDIRFAYPGRPPRPARVQ
jgi:MscS family membrane protein